MGIFNMHSLIEKKMNELGRKDVPFFFLIDFDMKNFYIRELKESQKKILFDIDGKNNYTALNTNILIKDPLQWKKPVDFNKYYKAFSEVKNELRKGNSYLLNLTFPSEIKFMNSLKELFYSAEAKFKLYFKNKFICFSPERFIKISNNFIYTFPMKGTMPSSVPESDLLLLNNEKERAEHVTVVDLLRNDLSMVSSNVSVNKFMYTEKINAGSGELWQASSEISGKLEQDWKDRIGTIITTLLPAGSVTGAPKRKTVEIIKKTERYNRGWYTGVFGYYENNFLDSAVIIRYIEKKGRKYFYKSGGGITIYSSLNDEYRELIDKIYIPVKGLKNER